MFCLMPRGFFVGAFFLGKVLIAIVFVCSVVGAVVVFVSRQYAGCVVPLTMAAVVSLVFLAANLLLCCCVLVYDLT